MTEWKYCCVGRILDLKTVKLYCSVYKKTEQDKIKNNGIESINSPILKKSSLHHSYNSKYWSKSYRIIRFKAISHYSNGKICCSCCGEDNFTFLTLDHPNNDGFIHRKKFGGSTAFLYWLQRNDFPIKLDVLCWNCNLGRQLNNGICPHQKLVISLSMLFTDGKNWF